MAVDLGRAVIGRSDSRLEIDSSSSTTYHVSIAMGRCQGVFELRSALVLAIAVAISGCASHGETYEAPLSAADCVVGWNSGMVAWEPVGGGGLRPTRESGLVARDLSVVAGSECRIAFRLPGNRLLVVASSGVRDASEAQQGLDWRLSQGTTNAFGVMNPLEAGLHNVTSGCQADTGEIMLSGCPAHDPAVSRFPINQVQLELSRRSLQAAGVPMGAKWLGPVWRGLVARPVGYSSGEATIGYSVQANGQLWLVDVVTSSTGLPAPKCDSPLRGPCGRAVHLFTTRMSKQWVSVFSIQVGGSGHAPLPASLTTTVRSGLQPIPQHLLAAAHA